MASATLDGRTGLRGPDALSGGDSPVAFVRRVASSGFRNRKPATDQLSQAVATPRARLLSHILGFSLSAEGTAKKSPEKIKKGLQELLLGEPTLRDMDFLHLLNEACRIKTTAGKYEDAARIALAFGINPAEFATPPELR